MFPATLTTERLRLRPRTLADAPAIYDAYGRDPEATRYLSWPTHRSVDDAHAFLVDSLRPKKTETHWAICLAGEAGLIGSFAAWRHRHAVELGYVLGRAHWGQGFITEASRAVLAAVWCDETVWRVHAYAHVDNAASQRVLEKCGLRREGVARRKMVFPQVGPEPQDATIFAQTRDDLA